MSLLESMGYTAVPCIYRGRQAHAWDLVGYGSCLVRTIILALVSYACKLMGLESVTITGASQRDGLSPHNFLFFFLLRISPLNFL